MKGIKSCQQIQNKTKHTEKLTETIKKLNKVSRSIDGCGFQKEKLNLEKIVTTFFFWHFALLKEMLKIRFLWGRSENSGTYLEFVFLAFLLLYLYIYIFMLNQNQREYPQVPLFILHQINKFSIITYRLQVCQHNI